MSPTGATSSSHSATLAVTRIKRRAVLLSIAAATGLTGVKLAVAIATDSVTVLSEAAHSMTDLVAALIALIAVQRAASPPDSRHRYGHDKFENASAIAEGTIILGAVSFVIYRALDQLLHGGHHVQAPLLASALMVGSALINMGVARRLLRIGAEHESAALTADGHHLMTDVYTSVTAAIGLALVAFTGNDVFDSIVALIVSALVVRIGLQLIVGGLRVLLDEGLPADEVSEIERVIQEGFGGVAGFHRLRTRRAGSRRHIDLHLTLDRNLPLWRAHEIAHNVEHAIARTLPNVDALIHIEPDDEAPPPGEDIGPGDSA